MKYLFYNVFGEVLIIFFVAKIGDKKNHSTAAKVFTRTMLEAKIIYPIHLHSNFKKIVMHSPFASCTHTSSRFRPIDGGLAVLR